MANAKVHFDDDYRRLVRDLIARYPVPEAMSRAVGGSHDESRIRPMVRAESLRRHLPARLRQIGPGRRYGFGGGNALSASVRAPVRRSCGAACGRFSITSMLS